MSSPATAAFSDLDPLSTESPKVTSLVAPDSALVTAAPLPQKSWTIEESEKLYRIQGWGEPYFSINAAGHVTVSPKGDRGGSLYLC